MNKLSNQPKSTMKYVLTFVILLLTLPNSHVAIAQDTEKIALAQEYDDKGETEKARALYDELVKKKKNIPIIHNRYVHLLLNTGKVKEAQEYMKKVLKLYPDNMLYQLDAGVVEKQLGDDAAADQYFNKVIADTQNDPFQVRIVAGHLIKNELLEQAIDAYQIGRKASKDQNLYALELANVYLRLNEKDQMVNEYLAYANEDPSRISYVKNILQNVLTEEEDLESLSALLLDRIQESPDNPLYSELLIWVNLQQKDFYGAFMQARAIDRRNKTEGDWVMQVAGIALENRDYKNALKMYEYVIEKYPRTMNYIMARRYKIKAREELVKNQFPIDQEEITKLIADYQTFVDESAQSVVTANEAVLEAMRSQALLYAFYKGNMTSAIEILQKVAESPRASPELQAMVKLDMGDIYVLLNEPWESTLLYSQVEKANKEELVGYEAKLRNAKLSYYKGDFELAQSHLDVLKEATTREIANDAMSLSLLIQNNTALDTTSTAMKSYADAELLLFQNKPTEALAKLDSMLQIYEGHDLSDEIYWLEAKVNNRLGNFEQTIKKLEKIRELYPKDILGDDALFMMGTVYEEQLEDETKAMEIYTQFLKDYPGSIYVADVRKRFRNLRGDFNMSN